MNNAANDAFITRLFFDPAGVQNFELVHSEKQVRIYRVK